MANPKEAALLQAAQSGAAAKVRQLLAQGVPVDARDVNRMTPVMLAAQGGHVDAFRALVDAGADLHATAFRQFDLLEAACRSDNVEIVTYLLEQGLPVNGHWQPANEVMAKMGHDTPLLQAVDNGCVEVVRLLLENGADRNRKYQGQTALDIVKERLRDPDFADERQQDLEIAALLGQAPAKADRSAEAELRAVKKFAANARKPGFVQMHKQLVKRCGAGRPWSPLPDHGVPAKSVVAFTLPNCKRQKVMNDLQKEAREAVCHLVLAEPWAPGESAKLVLFPTDDKLAVVAAVGTEGANHGIATPQVIAWLERLDQENPFDLTICNHESIGGSFLGPVKGVKKLADALLEFFPGSVDDVEDLVRALKKQRSFYLRWD